MILPAIELQAGVQASGKPGTQSAATNGGVTFSAAFGESLRETVQAESVLDRTDVDAKTPSDAGGGKAVSGTAASGPTAKGVAAAISGQVAEATSQVAKQSVDQASPGLLVATAKTPATSLNAAGASAADLAKSSAGGATEAAEPIGTEAVVGGTNGARVQAESQAKSNLVKEGLGDESEVLVAAGSEIAKSDAAPARVAAAGARAAALVNADASSLAAGKAKAVAADQTPDTNTNTNTASVSTLSQRFTAGAPAGKVAAAPLAILAGAVKSNVATPLAINSEPGEPAALKAPAGWASTTGAAAPKDTPAPIRASTAQAGNGSAKVATSVQDGEQSQALAGAADALIRSATSGAGAAGASTGAVEAKSPVTAKTTSAVGAASRDAAAPDAAAPGVKVQGTKSGVSGAGATVTRGKAATPQASALQGNAAEVAVNAVPGPASQRSAAVPDAQTALELPLTRPLAAAGATTNPASPTRPGTNAARTEQAQGSVRSIKAASDGKSAVKTVGTAGAAESDAKSSLVKVVNARTINGVATAAVAIHAGATQAGTAAVQAIAAAHVVPATVPENAGAKVNSSVHSIQSAGSSAQAGRAVAQANAAGDAQPLTEDKAAIAAATAGTVERPAVEGARVGDSSQPAADVAAAQSRGSALSRAGAASAGNSASGTAPGTELAAGAATSTPAGAASSPSFVQAAATAGVHAASVPAIAVGVANGAIAATTGVIATGHPAAVAGVAAGAGGVGSTGAGAVSAALTGVGGAARSDLATAAEPHRTLVATPTTLEVGVPDGTQGWLRIRAEVGDQGQVNASLAAGSGASQEMLHRDLPALNAYLHSEQMAVTATVSERSFTAAGGGQAGYDSGRTAAGDTGGAGSGSMTQGDASGGQQGNARQESGPASSVMNPAQGYSGTAGLSDAAIVNSTGVGYDGESGRWLNVSA